MYIYQQKRQTPQLKKRKKTYKIVHVACHPESRTPLISNNPRLSEIGSPSD